MRSLSPYSDAEIDGRGFTSNSEINDEPALAEDDSIYDALAGPKPSAKEKFWLWLESKFPSFF